jgi:hypothetical protein
VRPVLARGLEGLGGGQDPRRGRQVGPTNPAVVRGSPASFTVTAGGATPITYQWRKNGTNISGATGATYSIASAQTSDAASYDVVATNLAGSTTSAANTLTVNVPVAITAQPASLAVNPFAPASSVLSRSRNHASVARSQRSRDTSRDTCG